LIGLEFADRATRMSSLAAALERDWGAYTTKTGRDPAGAATRLEQYFSGDLAALDRQPVAYRGSAFQHAVWDALRTIPAGTTLSYAELAVRIGRPRAMRAAGAANGANRIALFVPCHRVIAADGTLWGYGGGLDNKRRLLEHERAAFVDRGTQRELAFTATRG
jgi:methylated-DNA-[protein]-cysteine S-methyltransferase